MQISFCLENNTYMTYPLHRQNTKKTKKPIDKTADFLVNTGFLVKLFQKKPK